MSRKRCHRRRVVPMLPKGLRPKLDAGQVLDLALAHHTNLDDFAAGRATPDVMWQMAGGVLTWSRVADTTGQHVDAMRQQLQMMHDIVERWKRTGRVLFTGPEYQLAKRGVEVMDTLAASVDKAAAYAAANWAEDAMQHIKAAADADVAAMAEPRGTVTC